MNAKLTRLIRQLGEAIHESVSESEDIAGVVRDIREEGFDVLLMLEATIGLNELDEENAEAGEGGQGEADGEHGFSQHDLSFLKSLRISIEEDGHAAGKPLALPPGDSSEASAG